MRKPICVIGEKGLSILELPGSEKSYNLDFFPDFIVVVASTLVLLSNGQVDKKSFENYFELLLTQKINSCKVWRNDCNQSNKCHRPSSATRPNFNY